VKSGQTQTWGPVTLDLHEHALEGAATITLRDAGRRNVMGPALFDGLEAAILQLEQSTAAGRFHPFSESPPDGAVRVVLVRGEGTAFCAGFDLGLLAEDPDPSQLLLASFLKRLGGCVRRLRALPATSVAVVQGPALAGGCALAMACDLTLACPEARLGYPVHAIGLSPAVSGPVLAARVGAGIARTLLMSGEILDGARAHAVGLVHRLAPDPASLHEQAAQVTVALLAKGPRALAATRRWLLELDGSISAATCSRALDASLATTGSVEGRALLQSAWANRSRR
jgi:methylglutaconyl-CoA hydratase